MMTSNEIILTIAVIASIRIFLPPFSQLVGKRFGQGFLQGINKEFDNQFDQFMKMQNKEKSIKKENENG